MRPNRSVPTAHRVAMALALRDRLHKCNEMIKLYDEIPDSPKLRAYWRNEKAEAEAAYKWLQGMAYSTLAY